MGQGHGREVGARRRCVAAGVLPCLAATCLLLVLAGCGGGPASDGSSTVVVGGHRVTVEVASQSAVQERGLSGRDSLDVGRGMLFVFDPPRRVSMWMHGMRFAVDALWLRGDHVVAVRRMAKPHGNEVLPVYEPAARADAVLEVPAGWARQHRIHRGSRVSR